MTPILWAFLVGAIFGSLITFAACALWAWSAMSPCDAPGLPTSSDQGSGKGQVPAGAENAPAGRQECAGALRREDAGEGRANHALMPNSDSARRIVEFLRAELQLPALLQSFEVRFAMGEVVTVKCEYTAQDRAALQAEHVAREAIKGAKG